MKKYDSLERSQPDLYNIPIVSLKVKQKFYTVDLDLRDAARRVTGWI